MGDFRTMVPCVKCGAWYPNTVAGRWMHYMAAHPLFSESDTEQSASVARQEGE